MADWIPGSSAGLNQTAAANSTGILPLAFANGDYLGQFNFNYNASDGSPQRILSPIFSVDNSPQARAVTWSQGVLALPTPSGSAVIQTSISASLVTSSDPQATKTTSNEAPSVSYLSATSSSLPVSSLSSTKGQSSATSSSLPVSSPSSTKGSSLGAGPIAGIVVGVVVCAGLAAALILYRLRKPSHVQPEVKAPSPAFFQSPVPVNLLGEKDGSPRRPKELSADAQLFEMASQNER